MQKLAVTGAGAAGWSAAAVLAEKCRDRAIVTLLEARDRMEDEYILFQLTLINSWDHHHLLLILGRNGVTIIRTP